MTYASESPTFRFTLLRNGPIGHFLRSTSVQHCRCILVIERSSSLYTNRKRYYITYGPMLIKFSWPLHVQLTVLCLHIFQQIVLRRCSIPHVCIGYRVPLRGARSVIHFYLAHRNLKLILHWAIDLTRHFYDVVSLFIA